MKSFKICFPDDFKQNGDLGKAIINRGHKLTKKCDSDYDFIFNMSAFHVDRAIAVHKKYPHIPVINYIWDYYKFAHEGKHWFNWKPYVEFIKKSTLNIVPSNAQKLRLKELLDLDSIVIRTGIETFDLDIRDKKFVLDHMRWYPEPNMTWIRDACDQQGIICMHPDHSFPDDLFRKAIASCTFLACGYQEASTGGLTIIEGLWNGKPTLLSDSPYQGGRDYMGDFGTYFKWDDFEDCKRKVKEMMDNPPKIDIQAARKYITENLTYEIMAQNIENEFVKIYENLHHSK